GGLCVARRRSQDCSDHRKNLNCSCYQASAVTCPAFHQTPLDLGDGGAELKIEIWAGHPHLAASLLCAPSTKRLVKIFSIETAFFNFRYFTNRLCSPCILAMSMWPRPRVLFASSHMA